MKREGFAGRLWALSSQGLFVTVEVIEGAFRIVVGIQNGLGVFSVGPDPELELDKIEKILKDKRVPFIQSRIYLKKAPFFYQETEITA